ncbi:MAG: ImmA/IrrE family metallo-endopeptidase [Lachnospiraceae bacterium]|nr:ImmA/IrrE family metallo-endopeptidase [Lachnospiraceae bacterium]
MDGVRKAEIREKAGQIEKESERYQMIHATYACQSLIRDSVSEYFTKEYDGLLNQVEERMSKGLDYDTQRKKMEELDQLRRKQGFHVDVAYVDMNNEDSARVVKIENAFVIYLPKSLGDSIIKEDGDFDYDTIRRVRKLMSHEIGHLILHTEDLLRIDGTQGSKELLDEDKEAEAEYFGQELINLRKERNRKITEDGGAYRLF